MMMKKKLFSVFMVVLCTTIHVSPESFSPEEQSQSSTVTVSPQLFRSPFVRDPAAFPSPFGLQSLGKYTRDLSSYERNQLLKISAVFSVIEAASATVSCIKTKDSYLLKGLFAFRALRAFCHLYLTYEAVRNFNPNEERETPDTEENKREAAASQYEVAWKVAGTIADSPLFQRIRQESYNYAHQPRGGLERFKPLLPVAYPLSAGLIGVAFDCVKIWQTQRSQPLVMNYKDTEHLLLEFGSLLAHTYASGNIIEMLPTSVKKNILAKGLAGTYYLSVATVGAFLVKALIATHGKEYEAWCMRQRKTHELGRKLPSSWISGDMPTESILSTPASKRISAESAFNTALAEYFKEINPEKRITIANPENAPKCMHCQEPIHENDEILVNKDNPQKVMHVRGRVDGHPHFCFIEKLGSYPESCVDLPLYWVVQKPTTPLTFKPQDYRNFSYRQKRANAAFREKCGEANTTEAMVKLITDTQRAAHYAPAQQAFVGKLKCPICHDSCATHDFITSGETHDAYHLPCIAKEWARQIAENKAPTDPITRTDVRNNWERWHLLTQAVPPTPATRQPSPAGKP